MRVKEGNKEKDILNAAVKVFAEHGYQNSKMQKIAEIAGVSTGSVYVYYKNKEAIFVKLVEQLWADLLNQLIVIEKRTDISAVDKFDSLIDILFDAFIDKPSLALAIINERNDIIKQNYIIFMGHYHDFMDLGEKIVLDGVKTKTFNPNFNTKIIRSFIFGGIRILLHQWARDPKNTSLNQLRQNVKYFCKRGMLNLS
jgi:TetR/AcrR family transcriptional regulator, fatty acid metabolism regulator protein